jgi:hypothetical protein
MVGARDGFDVDQRDIGALEGRKIVGVDADALGTDRGSSRDVTPARKMRAAIRHGIADDDGLASSKAAGREP